MNDPRSSEIPEPEKRQSQSIFTLLLTGGFIWYALNAPQPRKRRRIDDKRNVKISGKAKQKKNDEIKVNKMSYYYDTGTEQKQETKKINIRKIE